MAWIKARFWDVMGFTVLVLLFFGCNKTRPGCYAPTRTMTEQAVPSQSELRGMALDCAASDSAPGCADPLLDQSDLADEQGCSQELDNLFFCVEDGNARENGGTIEWACDSQERVYRACVEGGKDEAPAR